MSDMTFIDVTAPGSRQKQGNLHIISSTIREIEDIFTRLGFEIAEGPEVEDEWHNFDALNVPENHPARDMQDTFWIKGVDKTVLRTHTSGVQNRAMMEKKNPPFRIIAPGRVFRNEALDATHEAQFHQCEGLMVGKEISLANLKGVLLQFLQEFFGDDSVSLRFRPGYFPFVEPGIEVDVTCTKCHGENKECNVCKGSGWIEILGAGMVHPHVLDSAEINSKQFQGFAFGMGIERLVMLKYGVDDIRDFYDGDIPFIEQF